MSITKTLFEVTAINIISPAKNINEEGKKNPTKSWIIGHNQEVSSIHKKADIFVKESIFIFLYF